MPLYFILSSVKEVFKAQVIKNSSDVASWVRSLYGFPMLKTLTVGPLATNCYILTCDETHEAVVIDPGDEGKAILAFITKEKLLCKWILNTHAHADHIGANATVKKATNAKLGLHQDDRFLLERSVSMAMSLGIKMDPSPDPDKELQDKETISFGKERLAVLHTPGHSPGSVSFVWGQRVFSGDLLFQGGIGRDDLPGGSYQQIIQSIKKRILPLGDTVSVFPGHGPSTTVGAERRGNPYLIEDNSIIKPTQFGNTPQFTHKTY